MKKYPIRYPVTTYLRVINGRWVFVNARWVIEK
jgi:hypothetical protein